MGGKETLLFMKEVSWVPSQVCHAPWPPERVLHRGDARKEPPFPASHFHTPNRKALFPCDAPDFMQKSRIACRDPGPPVCSQGVSLYLCSSPITNALFWATVAAHPCYFDHVSAGWTEVVTVGISSVRPGRGGVAGVAGVAGEASGVGRVMFV